jgi:galactokinase
MIFLVRSAPALVNLIGEHTDYAGGLVLPMAIPFYSYATITQSPDTNYRFVSENFEADYVLERDARFGKTGGWSDYPVGVLRQLQAEGMEPSPFTMHLLGDVPLGAGLWTTPAERRLPASRRMLVEGIRTTDVKIGHNSGTSVD